MLLSSYFMYQAYEIFFNKEKWASSFYSAYGNFEEYWKPLMEKKLDNCFVYGERNDVELFYKKVQKINDSKFDESFNVE